MNAINDMSKINCSQCLITIGPWLADSRSCLSGRWFKALRLRRCGIASRMRLDLEQEQDHENDQQRGAKKTARKDSPKRQQINA
jgi:hypothetical protein